MTQYHTLNVTLSNSQRNKLKSGIKNDTDRNLKLSSNIAGDYNDENYFQYKMFLSNTQVLSLHKAFCK